MITEALHRIANHRQSLTRAEARATMALFETVRAAETVRRLVWSTGATGLFACILLALGLARLWSRPIRRITRTARNLSRGDLTARVRVGGSDELAELARSLNEMRDRLAAHLETNPQVKAVVNLVPILVDSDGPIRKIIDGSYRKQIADELGYDCPEIVQPGLADDELRTLARALNLARRQLDHRTLWAGRLSTQLSGELT